MLLIDKFENFNSLINETASTEKLSRKAEFLDDENVNLAKKLNLLAADEGRALKQSIQSVTKIDIGVQSQLLVAPGSTVQIYYDVTNLRSEPTFHNFQVQDEKGYLRQLQPRL